MVYRLLFRKASDAGNIAQRGIPREPLNFPADTTRRLGKTSASPLSQPDASTLLQQHAKLTEAILFFCIEAVEVAPSGRLTL